MMALIQGLGAGAVSAAYCGAAAALMRLLMMIGLSPFWRRCQLLAGEVEATPASESGGSTPSIEPGVQQP
jgi:hypothetical protein